MELLTGLCQAPTLALKEQAMVEVTENSKLTSLLSYGINYGRKKFYETD